MPTPTAADLVEALADLRLLDAAQLDKVHRAMKGRAPDPKAVARELLKHGWLTAFQADLLLQGRGDDLVLGPYVLLERLGEGGMGQVFKARHQIMDRTVAIKVIRKEMLAHPDAVQRFHQEIRAAAQLDHPHLVRAHDASQVGDAHFLVMEYAEGADLHRLVQESGPLPVGQACEYIRQAALGLQHAHERGLVHRDVKPANLQVTAGGATIKILDMGLARSQAADGIAGAGLTQARTMMGTPDYIAPEQIADASRVDGRADVYSLGCTLYFLLAGRPPFPVEAWEEKLVCHKRAEPQPIEQLRPDVPAALGAVLRQMMAKRPEERYAAPAAVADALAPLCAITGPGPGALQQPTILPLAAPVLPDSLVDHPAAAYVAGWTLKADSTVPTPATQAQVGKLLSEPTMLVAGQPPAPLAPGRPHSESPAQPVPGARKRFLLALAGGGAVLGVTVLLLILLWPKGDNRVAEIPGGSRAPVAGKNSLTNIEEDDTGWVQLFNGKDLTGWKVYPNGTGKWKVENGLLIGKGPFNQGKVNAESFSHLFSARGDYKNFRFRVEATINATGNSGQFFRTQFGPDDPNGRDPKGYKAQIATLRGDPQRTGSLYDIFGITRQLHEPDEWFRQEVIAKGDHIVIKVNDHPVVDVRDGRYTSGHFALQFNSLRGPSEVKFYKIEVKELPD